MVIIQYEGIRQINLITYNMAGTLTMSCALMLMTIHGQDLYDVFNLVLFESQNIFSADLSVCIEKARVSTAKT